MTNGPMPKLTHPAEQPEDVHSVDAAAALQWCIDRVGKPYQSTFQELLDGLLTSLRTGDPTFIGRNRPVDMVIHRLAVVTVKYMIRNHQTERLASVYPLAQFRCTLAQNPCQEARDLHGRIYGNTAERPDLPLKSCNVLDCACRYRLMTRRQALMQGQFYNESDGIARREDTAE